MPVRLLAIVLALAIWPGTGEAAEYAVHWLQDGDAVHGAGHYESSPTPDEDGCPDAGHLCHLSSCSCHGQLAPAIARATALPALSATHFDTPAPRAHTGLADPAPLIRPPIA